MSIFKFIFKAIKPFLPGMKVKIDRERQIITFEQNGQVEILTVDQLFDEIENMFAGPDLAVRTDRQNGPGSPQEAPRLDSNLRAWLTNCDKPLKDPFKYIDQAHTEPARPPVACQTEAHG